VAWLFIWRKVYRTVPTGAPAPEYEPACSCNGVQAGSASSPEPGAR
jgi:hypothetical protein